MHLICSEFILELLSGVKDGPETTFNALTLPKFSSTDGLVTYTTTL